MISNIQAGYAGLGITQTQWERPQAAPAAQTAPAAAGDVLDIRHAALRDDAEAAQALSDVRTSLEQGGQAEALSAHGGLDYSRVMALLEGL